ncbi:MAG TPA: hypothetical protein VI341_06435 [Actinomycetota bacterium]
MMVFILILLLLAAIFGILGAVLKAVAFLVITGLLTITVLGALAYWALKRKARQFQREMEGGSTSAGPRFQPNEADPTQLPSSRDDRY